MTLPIYKQVSRFDDFGFFSAYVDIQRSPVDNTKWNPIPNDCIDEKIDIIEDKIAFLTENKEIVYYPINKYQKNKNKIYYKNKINVKNWIKIGNNFDDLTDLKPCDCQEWDKDLNQWVYSISNLKIKKITELQLYYNQYKIFEVSINYTLDDTVYRTSSIFDKKLNNKNIAQLNSLLNKPSMILTMVDYLGNMKPIQITLTTGIKDNFKKYINEIVDIESFNAQAFMWHSKAIEDLDTIEAIKAYDFTAEIDVEGFKFKINTDTYNIIL